MQDVEIDHMLDLPVADVGSALLGTPEGQWFERKSARIKARELAVPLIAMGNAEGGRIVVGLHDGRVETVSTDRENELRQVALDFTRPAVRHTVSPVPVICSDGRAGRVLVFTVEPGDAVHELTNGDCYLRVGDESRRLSFAQRQELHFDRGSGPYDGTPVDGLRTAESVVESAEARAWAGELGASSPASLMQARGLLNGQAPTVAAYLLFHDHPQARFPHALVRVLRFSSLTSGSGGGFTLDDDADLRCEGPIPHVIQQAADHIDRLLPRRRALRSSGRFEPIPMVPRDAWLEGLVNAVIHRSYSMSGDHVRVEIYPDRVVIESPGRFPGVVDLSKPELIARFARNPRIARVCSDLRIAQEFGEGIRRIFEEMRLRGLTEPIFWQTAGSVRLTLSSADAIPADVRARLPRGSADTLDALRRAGRALGTAEIVELVGLSRPTTLRHLNALREQGLVGWEGKSRKDPRASWSVI